MTGQASPLITILPFLWIGGWVTASIVYRRSRGKPILFFTVPGASFIERTASGHSQSHWYTRFGGASNCLVVAIHQGKLIIRPFFPFNMMFLPEIYGLELEIPIEHIQNVELRKGLFKRMVLEYRDENREKHKITLLLKKPKDFLLQLPGSVLIIGAEKDKDA